MGGQPYRGVGANYFDLLLRVLHDPANTSSLDGLERLGKSGIPFVRFAVAYDAPVEAVSGRSGAVLPPFRPGCRGRKRANVGLIPSVFWSFMSFPDLVKEPRPMGNPHSRTIALMREVVGAIVERYKDSSAIWAWEFGNERT